MISIPGFASSISYHPTGRVAEILHANGQRFTEQPDPHGMARPAGLRLDQPNGSRVDWQLGPFEFDGSGNLTRVGGWFGYGRYDRVSRWTGATMEFSPRGFVYDVAAAYDDFGNLTGLSRGTDWIETPTVPATNRLKYGSYDASGNLTAWHGQTFLHDPLGRLAGRCTRWDAGKEQCTGADWAYAYGPDEGRVLSYRFAPGTREWIWTDQPVRRAGEQPYSIWTLRDEGGRVLHERRFAWNAVGAEMEDYVWRGEGVLAAFLRPQGTVRHFALDHLGSVRVVSDGSGALLEHRRYEPYGHNPVAPQLDERRQWAGHERDLGDLTSPEDDLDYMQARFYSATLGRFLSTDPLADSTDQSLPQSWNRYTYVLGNPLKFIDPYGLRASCHTLPAGGTDEGQVVCTEEIEVVEDGPRLTPPVTVTPWRVGWEWLSGTGPRDRFFTDGDRFTVMLKRHENIQKTVKSACEGSAESSGRMDYRLGGIRGISNYLRDYSTLATGGSTGNLAVTYLGSYGGTYALSGGIVYMQVTNTSAAASAIRPPVLGYTDWWQRTIDPRLNQLFASGPMSATTQTFAMSAECP